MPAVFHTTRRVEFADTDAAGIAHFAAFFRWMEEAEHEFWRSLDLSVILADGDDRITWPRVRATCDYASPVRFEDVLDIDVSIARMGDKSVTFEFHFACGGREIASGELSAVCCRLVGHESPRSIAIPAATRERLAAFSALG
jgi:4-hydroxybenzoyl-CoA thioesterase/acyl-CoA thioester hydrolase